VAPEVKSLTRDELELQFQRWNEPPYRVTQLLQWLYARRAATWDAMKNLPLSLREKLRGHFSLQTAELILKVGSRDTTQKFLWRLADHSLIESVLIPANPALYGEASDRHTLCISTQVGCAYGCKFCASGLEGWKRNLEPNEIVEQVLAVERDHDGSPAPNFKKPRWRAIDNIVAMGMGEPLANYDNVLKALKILNAPWGGGIAARKITISTSGLAPQIRRLADEPLQFRLAVSLHGATDDVRDKLMPVNRKFPVQELVAACEAYQRKKGRMITLEYILISGVNDSMEQIRPLAAIARKLFAKVNLIPYNRVEGLAWRRPSDDVCERFLAALQRQNVAATLRREKGDDIDAACGQLRLKTERDWVREKRK
jgi:23S rRNA (adenine2503-C2)-methyltransferase